MVSRASNFFKGRDGVGCLQFLSSLHKQISPFQTSTDKIIRHSEHNSVLYSATKGSSLVSLHLLSQGCGASIIMLSKRASLERQEYSFHTLTVDIKWSALTFCQNGGTFLQRSPRDPPPYNKSFIDFWYWRSFRTKSQTPKCHICFDASCLFVLNLKLARGWCILVHLLKRLFMQFIMSS